jgi:hypothetical protein
MTPDRVDPVWITQFPYSTDRDRVAANRYEDRGSYGGSSLPDYGARRRRHSNGRIP